jgi:hypothetical protein
MSREPEWNAENMNKKKGDTTLKTCGWCQYQGCGSYRHSCMLSGDCELMKSYGNEREVEFDTVCKIIQLSPDDVSAIIKSKEYDIKESENSIKESKKEIEALRKIKKTLKYKPMLADSRPYNYYNVNDVVYTYCYDGNVWKKAKVVEGYRHHDGCVSFIYEGTIVEPGHAPGAGCGRPELLKEKEFQYFSEQMSGKKLDEWLSKIDLRTWLKSQDRIYNGKKLEIDSIVKAFCDFINKEK